MLLRSSLSSLSLRLLCFRSRSASLRSPRLLSLLLPSLLLLLLRDLRRFFPFSERISDVVEDSASDLDLDLDRDTRSRESERERARLFGLYVDVEQLWRLKSHLEGESEDP